MVKVFNAETRQLTAFESVNEHNRASFMKLISVKAVSNPVLQLIAAFGLAAVLYMAIRDVLQERLSSRRIYCRSWSRSCSSRLRCAAW